MLELGFATLRAWILLHVRGRGVRPALLIYTIHSNSEERPRNISTCISICEHFYCALLISVSPWLHHQIICSSLRVSDPIRRLPGAQPLRVSDFYYVGGKRQSEEIRNRRQSCLITVVIGGLFKERHTHPPRSLRSCLCPFTPPRGRWVCPVSVIQGKSEL